MFPEPVSLFPVALAACSEYGPGTRDSVFAALETMRWRPSHGDRVLVKPNLLRADALSCTHPLVVATACEWLLDAGARVTVADSPGFGTARGVARHIGLEEALASLGLGVEAMRDPVPVKLPDGKTWGVARTALEKDAILSVPRIKAHSQMRLTLAVKNLFGCICGLRKALAHTAQGNEPGLFEACVAELWAQLPPSAALADAVVTMHRTGPSGGEPYTLGCVAASSCSVALDTAFYTMFGVEPAQVPLWNALQDRDIPQSRPDMLAFPLLEPCAFDASGFMVPGRLVDISFRPHRLMRSFCKRLWYSVRG